MMRWIRELVTSWRLDGGASAERSAGGGDRIMQVDRLLTERAGQPIERLSEGFSARLIESIRTAEERPVVGRISVSARGWPLAAAACLMVGIGVAILLRPTPQKHAATGSGVATLNLPVGPQPMLRLVSGTFDQPLRDETAKMVSDTRRATRAMVQCVPFTRSAR